ncbi:LAFA_0F15764g1_1 [Lachancea sp. 'fantastica']|nr:LAFA_0F15764g1_1 [Lachancea sp. 'fantastica']
MPQSRGQGKKTRDSDLRSQLEDMQKRIDHETEEALSKRDSKKHSPFSNILSKRDKRTSMPVFAGSSTHNNVVNSDSSKDVNFMVGLSENLLMECRRLQAENEKKSLKLKSLQQESEVLNTNFNALSTKFQGAQQEGLSLKDTNWELETKLQDITEQLRELRDSSERTKKELHSKMSMYDEIQTKYEEVHYEKQGLETQLKNTQQQSAADLAELKRNIVELNEENDDLQRKVDEMSTEIGQLTTKHEEAKELESSLAPDFKSSELETSKSRTLDSPEAADLRKAQVQLNEPIDSKLAEANRVIDKLKQQIFLLQKAQGENRKAEASNSKVSQAKAVKTLHESAPHAGASTFDDSIDSLEASRSLDYSSDIDSVGDVTDTMDAPRNPILDDLSGDEGLNLDYGHVKKFADSHDLVLLSKTEYTLLRPMQKGIEEKSDVLAQENSKSVESSDEFMIAHLQDKNYVVYSPEAHQEIDNVLSSWNSPPGEYLEGKATEQGKRIITEQEYESFKSPTLAALTEQLAKFNFTALSTNELDVLKETAKNSSQEFLDLHLNSHNKVAIPSDLYTELLKPTIETLRSQAKNAGFELIDSSKWESTVSNLENPTLAYLSEAAEKRGSSLISKELHETLRSPGLADLSRRATELKHILLSEKDYEKLNNTDRSWVQKKAGSIGLVVLTKHEHENLLRPSQEQLKEKVEAEGHHVISSEEYSILINPDVNRIAQMAAKFDLECISTLEITQLRQILATPDDAFIKAKGLERNLKVFEEDEYQKLVAELELPKLETVEKSVRDHYLKPVLNWLSDELDFLVFKKEDYNELLRKAEDPSNEELQKLTHDRGLVMLEVKRHEEMTRCVEQPGLDFLQNHCGTYDKVLIDQQKWSDMNAKIESPTMEYLKDHAKNKGLHLSDFDNLTALKNQVDEPDLAYLISKCKSLGYEVVKKEEFQELLKNAEEPSRSYLDSKLGRLGYMSIESDELMGLHRQLEQPEKSFLDEKLKTYGYLPVEEQELLAMEKQLKETLAMKHQLEKPALTYLEKKAKEQGFSMIEEETLSSLRTLSEDPELPLLEEKLRKFDMVPAQILGLSEDLESPAELVAVKREEYQSMSQSLNNPTQSYLELKLKNLGMKAIGDDEYSKLVDLRDNPDQSFLEEKLAIFGLCILQKDRFSQLSINGERPDLASLRAEVERHGSTVIDQSELRKLKETATSPKMSFLEECLKEKGFIPVSESNYREMLQNEGSQDMAQIEQNLGERNMVAVDAQELSNLKKHVEVPELTFLKMKLEEKGFAAIEANELAALKSNASSPPIALMEEKLKESGYHVMKIEEYGQLKDFVENPTLPTLRQKASNLGLLLIPEAENRKMVEMLNDPPLDFIESKIKGHALVPNDVLKSLKATAASPSLEFLTTESNKLGYALIKKTEHQELISKVESPSLSDVKIYATKLESVVLTEEEHNTLQDAVKNPSRSFISEKSSALGLVVLSENDYTTMMASSKPESAIQKVEELGMKAIPEEEYIRLCNENVNIATVERLKSQLATFGSTVISVTELETLKRPLLERLDDKVVLEFCEKNNLAIMSQEEFSALKLAIAEPPESVLQACAEKSGKVLISSHELADLREEAYSAPLEALQRGSEKLKLVLVDKPVYQKMVDKLENPPLDWMEVQVEKMGKVVLDKTQYDMLLEIGEKPSMEHLKAKAAQQDHSVLSLEEYQNLLSSLEKPSETYIKEKATGMGLVTIDGAELEELRRREAFPEVNELELKVEKIGKVIASREEVELLKNPPVEFLRDAAQKHDFVLIAQNEYTELCSVEDRMSVEDIGRLASRLSCTIVTNADLKKMQDTIEKPTLEYICSKAALREKGVVDTEELHLLEDNNKKLANPTPEFVAYLASAVDRVLVGQEEYEELKATMAKPGEDYLKSKASDMGFALVDKTVYEKGLSTLDTPSMDYLKEKANIFECEVVPASLWEQYSTTADKPTLEFLENKVKLYPDHIIISKEHLEKLELTGIESSKIPTRIGEIASTGLETPVRSDIQDTHREGPATLGITEIHNAANSLGLTVVSVQEFESMLEKLETITRVKSPRGRSPAEVRDTFGNVTRSDDASSVHLSRTVTNSSEYFDALQSEPNDSLFNGSLDVSSAYYTDALSNQQLSRVSTLNKEGSMDCVSKLEEQAKSLGFVLVKANAVRAEESSNVQDRTFCEESLAPALEMRSSPLNEDTVSDEASTISSSASDWDENDLKERAAKLGLVVITENENALFLKLKTLQTEKGQQGPMFIPETFTEEDALIDHENDLYANGSSSMIHDTTTATRSQESQMQVEFNNQASTNEEADLGCDSRSINRDTDSVKERSPDTTVDNRSSRLDAGKFSGPFEKGDMMETGSLPPPSANHSWNKAELIEKAHEFGLVSLEAEQFALIKEELAAAPKTLTLDDLMIKAAEFDLVPIQKKQFEQIKEELSNPSMTKEQIMKNATAYGLVTVEKEEFERLAHRKSRSEDDEFTSSGVDETELSEDNEDKMHLDALAKKLGLMCVPESAFVATTSAGGMDPQNVVVLPSTYYDYILAKDQEGLKMATNDELLVEAKKRGLSSNGKVNSTQPFTDVSPQRHKVSRQSTIHSNLSSESGNRRTLAEAAANAAYNDYDMVTIRSHGRRTSLSSGRQPILNAEVGVRQTSFDGGISLATVASLSEPSIIPALTQTVIGEYLYKYYRRLGPIANVSSRHERYFWVHPYTLTLYWSTHNPVLGNPATNKTRAAAILGVESLDDPNPYPVGLYHKSIVIKTETRSVKITCATRQRHNIWFNSLRYLIQRNMDGIELDDPAADSTDTNKIYQLPGETPQLTNQRLSSTRRGFSAGSAKRSTSTRTLRP